MIGFWTGFFIIGFCLATLAYGVARRVQLMAIADTIWASALGLGAIVYLIVGGLEAVHAYLVCLVIAVWSFRLSFHLFNDRVFKGKEDPRYENLAAYWGKHSKRNFYFLFLAQIPSAGLFLLPVTLALGNQVAGLPVMDVLALLIALCALGGEFIADQQLARFRNDAANSKGVCQRGLWRYSRHPNYFFEWLHWWAYVAFAWGADNWWLTLLGPLAMYVFLRFITGVPHAERSSLKHRGEAYRQYQQTTNAFFPWIPRQAAS